MRLEPLERAHIPGLLAAAGRELELFRWTTVPQTLADMSHYVASALAARNAGTAFPLAAVRLADKMVVGSSRFFDIERWARPARHPAASRRGPDGCEIGYTWLAPHAIRSGINTEMKLLMLQHAFEAWGVHRVCFHTDARNERSRNALGRIGARFEGVLRAHRIASDLTPRDSARFSIIAAEWPAVKERLQGLLAAR